MNIIDATRDVAQKVGMNFCAGRDGFDPEIVRLAHAVGFRRDDICRSPDLVAASITEYLDDLVKNP